MIQSEIIAHMGATRAERLIFLRYQIRALKKRQRILQALLAKSCHGLHLEATQELERTKRHLVGAESALQALLEARAAPPTK